MSSGARCEFCRRTCSSSDVLAGMRCEWCGVTVSVCFSFLQCTQTLLVLAFNAFSLPVFIAQTSSLFSHKNEGEWALRLSCLKESINYLTGCNMRCSSLSVLIKLYLVKVECRKKVLLLAVFLFLWHLGSCCFFCCLAWFLNFDCCQIAFCFKTNYIL